MRYEKPVILNLNARARSVTGQLVTLGCHSGATANAGGEECGTGGGGGNYGRCRAGNNPNGGQGDCVPGSSAYYCESGSSGNNDPNGCRTGISP